MRMWLAVALVTMAVAVPQAHAASSSDTKEKATSVPSCPCSGTKACVGPRGGHYCITPSGTKRYLKKK